MQTKIIPVREKIVADFITPVSGYIRMGSGDYSFLLESAEKGKAGRFSFVGFCPRRVYELYTDRVDIMERAQENPNVLTPKKTVRSSDPLAVIQEVQDRFKVEDNGSLPPFCGGLVGYSSYEMIETFENLCLENRPAAGEPLGVFIFSDEIIAFDHLHNTAEIIKLVSEEEGEDKARLRILQIKNRLLNTQVQIKPMAMAGEGRPEYKSNFTESEFKKGVNKIKEEIMSGEIIQGVFSQRLTADAPDDVFDCYRALRVVNPSPYMFYLKLKDTVLCGSSPEVMVKSSGGKACLKPIAGTRKRSLCSNEEKELKEDLKKDPKEIAEHIMLVDLGRNDLGKVCSPGSVKVKNLMAVEKYSHVMHMVTEIEGNLAEGIGNTDVFKACFPAGTVSGAPKLRAMQIIDSLEKTPRGPYAGAVGYFSFTGDMDTCIAIRTMVVKGKKVFIQAGAGIVADSVPEKEYIETMNKAGALLQALYMAGSGKEENL